MRHRAGRRRSQEKVREKGGTGGARAPRSHMGSPLFRKRIETDKRRRRTRCLRLDQWMYRRLGVSEKDSESRKKNHVIRKKFLKGSSWRPRLLHDDSAYIHKKIKGK